MEDKGFANVNNIVIQLNDCMIDVIRKNNIVDETKTFMDFLTSDQWVETAEDGTR
jgi:hypothetical protein